MKRRPQETKLPFPIWSSPTMCLWNPCLAAGVTVDGVRWLELEFSQLWKWHSFKLREKTSFVSSPRRRWANGWSALDLAWIFTVAVDCSVYWQSTFDCLHANILREPEQGGQPGKLILPHDGCGTHTLCSNHCFEPPICLHKSSKCQVPMQDVKSILESDLHSLAWNWIII